MRRWRACGRTIESEHFVRVAAEFYGTIARFLEQFPRSGSHCPARMLSPACTAATHDVSAADAECSCTILRIHSGGSRRGIYPDDFHFEFFDSRWHVSIKSRTARLPCHHACLVHVLTVVIAAPTGADYRISTTAHGVYEHGVRDAAQDGGCAACAAFGGGARRSARETFSSSSQVRMPLLRAHGPHHPDPLPSPRPPAARETRPVLPPYVTALACS